MLCHTQNTQPEAEGRGLGPGHWDRDLCRWRWSWRPGRVPAGSRRKLPKQARTLEKRKRARARDERRVGRAA